MSAAQRHLLKRIRCGDKRTFETHDEAEAVAAQHTVCWKCTYGTARMTAYACPNDPPHFHIGHERTAEVAG